MYSIHLPIYMMCNLSYKNHIYIRSYVCNSCKNCRTYTTHNSYPYVHEKLKAINLYKIIFTFAYVSFPVPICFLVPPRELFLKFIGKMKQIIQNK